MNHPEIILASSSQTRKDLMNRLRLDYHCISPEIDESPQGESHADDLAKRLAFEKAQVIAQDHPNAIVIGSDQVAWREHAPQDFIGKPLSVEKAIQQAVDARRVHPAMAQDFAQQLGYDLPLKTKDFVRVVGQLLSATE